MARITVDDCLKHIPNRFDLTLARRPIARASSPTAPRRWSNANRDKPTVIALRELAGGHYGLEILNKGQA